MILGTWQKHSCENVKQTDTLFSHLFQCIANLHRNMTPIFISIP